MILFGHNDAGALGEGWYDAERSPDGVLYRAMQPRAELIAPGEGRWRMVLYASARAEDTGEALKIVCGNDTAHPLAFATNGWTTRMCDVQCEANRTVELLVMNPWSPDGLYRNGDARSLGALVSAVRWLPRG